jgi:hypothetical protein
MSDTEYYVPNGGLDECRGYIRYCEMMDEQRMEDALDEYYCGERDNSDFESDSYPWEDVSDDYLDYLEESVNGIDLGDEGDDESF